MIGNEIGEMDPSLGRFQRTRNMPAENIARSCTVRDIARLAGVSTATVSRVVNGIGSVSLKTRTKVLAAISRFQYCANIHAAELGRTNAGIPRKQCKDRGPSYATGANELNSSSMANGKSNCPKGGRLRILEDENSRLRRLFADLGLDPEISQTIAR